MSSYEAAGCQIALVEALAEDRHEALDEIERLTGNLEPLATHAPRPSHKQRY